MKKVKIFSVLLVFLLSFIFVLPFSACKDDTEAVPEIPEESGAVKMTEDDFLTANGKYLYNAKGERIVLKGVNLGGWLHMEGWMDGGGYSEKLGDFVNHYAVVSSLLNRFTVEETESLLETYQKNYIKKSDLEFIKSLGLNYVRVPFFWTEIMDFDGNIKSNAFDQLDWVVRECSEIGLYVLLDLHGSVGGHSNGWLSGGHSGSNELWSSEECRLKTDKIWRAVAGRYKDEPAVMGYDLLNEPVPPENSPISTNDMYDRYYKIVRNIDSRHVIVTEAFYYYDALKSPEENGWENVVYEVHFYSDSDKSPENQQSFINWIITDLLSYRDSFNVPMLFGEYNFWQSPDAWRTCMSSLTAYGISWSSWTYKNIDKTKTNYWGYYYNANVRQVDFENDSFETIAEKWAGYSTENYEENESLTSIIKDCADLTLPEEFGKEVSFNGSVVDAYRANGGDSVISMFDGDPTTRWSNGEPQNSDGQQWLTVNFGGTVKLKGISLFTPNPDVAKHVEIYYKRRNEEWKKLTEADCVIGRTLISFPVVEAGSVKIVNAADTQYSYWSIYELSFFESI